MKIWKIKQEDRKNDSTTTGTTTEVTLPEIDGANMLNMWLEETQCPVQDTSDVILDNFLPFSILNDGTMIIDQQVTLNNGDVNTNKEEKLTRIGLFLMTKVRTTLFTTRNS